VKHEEPKWWQKVFRFLDTGAGRTLSSALGFPAITQPALALLQKVLERLTAAHYPVDTIPVETLTVTVTAGDDSVEAQARDRALALMSDVRAAEKRAAERGMTLDSPEAWAAVLDENPA
jgi:XTP/dITP diphosphohydrolase